MTQKDNDTRIIPALLFAIGFRLLITFYWITRYSGNWVENDSSRTTIGVLSVFQTGELIPKGRFLYSNGFLFPVLGTVLARLAGISVQNVQLWVLPFLGVAITIAAFAFYRRILGSSVVAAIAVTILNLQGDYIITSLRGSHEKVDYLLIFVALLVLALSVRWFESPQERIALAVIYYFVILAENTTNVFFASTFTVTLILSFLFWYGLVRFIQNRFISLRWVGGAFLFALLATALLVLLLYPPEITGTGLAGSFLLKWAFLFFVILTSSLLFAFFAQDYWSKDSIIKQLSGASWPLYVSIVSMVFIFIVVFVWYRPAYTVVTTTGDITERIRLFLTTPVSAPASLLDVVESSSILPGAWLWLRVYDIVMLLMAGIGWAVMVGRLRRSGIGTIQAAVTDNFWMLVLLPAFSLQNFLFIFSDLTGGASQISNIQIRLIPLTTIIAAPTVAFTLVELVKWLRTRRVMAFRVAVLSFCLLAFLSLGLSLIKGVSEPVLSNSWIFFLPSEKAGVGWLDSNMPQLAPAYSQNTPLVWAGPGPRIGNLWLGFLHDSTSKYNPFPDSLKVPYSYVFISPLINLLAERYQISLPDLRDGALIYDNGQVQIYFEPPEVRR